MIGKNDLTETFPDCLGESLLADQRMFRPPTEKKIQSSTAHSGIN